MLRNDLSRVCAPGSVRVPVLCGLESYASVHHLTSVVTGVLKPDKTVGDLIAAVFPGGSITGAPKIRAMEVIAEIEGQGRGIYCGSIGYFGFNGQVDLSIAIRTAMFSQGTARFLFEAVEEHDGDVLDLDVLRVFIFHGHGAARKAVDCRQTRRGEACEPAGGRRGDDHQTLLAIHQLLQFVGDFLPQAQIR